MKLDCNNFIEFMRLIVKLDWGYESVMVMIAGYDSLCWLR